MEPGGSEQLQFHLHLDFVQNERFTIRGIETIYEREVLRPWSRVREVTLRIAR